MTSGPKRNVEWWQVLLDGKPHDVDIRETEYRTMTLLRAAIYRQAEVFNKTARSKRLDPFTLRVQAWPQRDLPGRGQVEEGIEPLPTWELKPEPETGLNQELVDFTGSVLRYHMDKGREADAAGLPRPSLLDIFSEPWVQDQLKGIKKDPGNQVLETGIDRFAHDT